MQFCGLRLWPPFYMLIINIKNPKKKLFSESTVKDAGMF